MKEKQIQGIQGQENTGLQLEDEYKPKLKMKKCFSFLIFIFAGSSKKTARRQYIQYPVIWKNIPTTEDIQMDEEKSNKHGSLLQHLISRGIEIHSTGEYAAVADLTIFAIGTNRIKNVRGSYAEI